MKRLCLLLLPMTAACASVPGVTSMLTPYKIDVRQGNYVSQDMAAQLKPGLTRDQVRFILGTPLITDLFHGERWDYVYRLQPGRGEVEQRHLSVFFADGKLARLGGDVAVNTPTSADAATPKPSTRMIDIQGDAATATADKAGVAVPTK